MSFDGQMAIDASFEVLGKPALYTPTEGAPSVAITVIPASEDTLQRLGYFEVQQRSDVFEIRKSDVAVAPAKGATITRTDTGETFRVKAPARCLDPDRLVWMVEAPLVPDEA